MTRSARSVGGGDLPISAASEMRAWRIHAEGYDAIPAATLSGGKAIAARFRDFVRIEHVTSGESWVRRGPGDEWRQDRPPAPGHAR